MLPQTATLNVNRTQHAILRDIDSLLHRNREWKISHHVARGAKFLDKIYVLYSSKPWSSRGIVFVVLPSSCLVFLFFIQCDNKVKIILWNTLFFIKLFTYPLFVTCNHLCILVSTTSNEIRKHENTSFEIRFFFFKQ